MNYRVSEFCHFISGDGLVALYNSLTLGIVIVDQETAASLEGLPNGVIPSDLAGSLFHKDVGEDLLQSLLEQKLIIPVGKQTDVLDYAEIQKGLNCKKIGILYLLTTDACNLACSYCFVESGIPDGHHYSMMSPETAESAVDLFAVSLANSHGIDEPQIIFYGGEPLSNLKTVKHALNYIGEKKAKGILPANTSITINTNGTLINAEVLQVLKGVDNLTVAISVDGPKAIHDASRVYHSGSGTFYDVVNGYDTLVAGGVNTGLCCTINEANVGNMQQIADWFVSNFSVESLGFNILIGNASSKEHLEQYSHQTAAQLIECFKIFREKGVYEDRFMRKVKAFTNGSIYYRDCGGCGEQIVVTPSGMVGTCQGYCGNKKYYVPLTKKLNPLEHPVWEEWRYRSPLMMDACRNCVALSLCGGGCPYNADIRNGSIWEVDDVFCVHAKSAVEFLVKELLTEARTETQESAVG